LTHQPLPHQSLTFGVEAENGMAAGMALLIAAHGERRPGAGNESVSRLARAISEKGLVAEVAVGFINGEPTVAGALLSLAARSVIVYPLFAANGYFTRDRLAQILDEANGQRRAIHILPPLGLDPAVPKLIADRLADVARDNDWMLETATVILLAHGSRRNPASREATERVAEQLADLGTCRTVEVAFLEERPMLEEAANACPGPAIVVGMFSGEGLHGARDAPRLIAGLGRSDIVYAGVIGNAPGIEDVVGSSVLGHIRAAGNSPRP
jgi:sirohydrochlorin ferrochelatase